MPVGSFLASSGGPFTIHPWPPVTKLFLSLTSLADLQRPVEKISLTQVTLPTYTALPRLYVTRYRPLNLPPLNQYAC